MSTLTRQANSYLTKAAYKLPFLATIHNQLLTISQISVALQAATALDKIAGFSDHMQTLNLSIEGLFVSDR